MDDGGLHGTALESGIRGCCHMKATLSRYHLNFEAPTIFLFRLFNTLAIHITYCTPNVESITYTTSLLVDNVYDGSTGQQGFESPEGRAILLLLSPCWIYSGGGNFLGEPASEGFKTGEMGRKYSVSYDPGLSRLTSLSPQLLPRSKRLFCVKVV